MKRKILTLLILVLACFLCFFLFMLPKLEYREKRIGDVINIKNDDITKIVMMDGRSMSTSIKLEDKESIDKFMRLLNDDVIRKIKNPQVTHGYIYIVTIYNNKNILGRIIIQTDLIINDGVYKVIKGDFTLKTAGSIMDEFRN